MRPSLTRKPASIVGDSIATESLTAHTNQSASPTDEVRSSLDQLARQVAAAGDVSAERAVHVLVVSAAEEEHRFLRHLFDHTNWFIHTARCCGEAAELLRGRTIPVVLCDYDLPDGSWRNMLSVIESSQLPALLIVASHRADDFLWAEVLNLGGYDVLMKPYEPSEVVRVVSLAWLHWKNLRERARLHSSARPSAPADA